MFELHIRAECHSGQTDLTLTGPARHTGLRTGSEVVEHVG